MLNTLSWDPGPEGIRAFLVAWFGERKARQKESSPERLRSGVAYKVDRWIRQYKGILRLEKFQSKII
ncbi:hypothetical protein FHT86_001937 [Rhizobium sp. BK313]|uniref:hypothetical protein n=1 Tax=Rhizobium sp. BK313 TaxID=2587081 RepID=UPI00105E94ED|nr:hypothetical protein [Rhizobium sp. BK313]MBB3453681.1 hypothetical protein [Rhizobium sp. BK313]